MLAIVEFQIGCVGMAQRQYGCSDARLFFPWHRAYLYRFEQALQDQVSDVTIPWWDWRTKKIKTTKFQMPLH